MGDWGFLIAIVVFGLTVGATLHEIWSMSERVKRIEDYLLRDEQEEECSRPTQT